MGNKHGCCVYPGGRSSRSSSNHKSIETTSFKNNKDNNIVILSPSYINYFPSQGDLLLDHKPLQFSLPFPNNLSKSYSEKDQSRIPFSNTNHLHISFPSSTYMSSSRDTTNSYHHSLPTHRVHTTYFPCSSSFSDSNCDFLYPDSNTNTWYDSSFLSLPAHSTQYVLHSKTNSEPVCVPSYCQMTHSLDPSPKQGNGSSSHGDHRNRDEKHSDEAASNLQHISEREPDDLDQDPSLHPTAGPLFLSKSKQASENGVLVRKRSRNYLEDNRTLKKSSSCSTIYLDDSTVSQPNLKNTIKCVALAIYYHIKFRASNRIIDIFDEKLHPLTRDGVHPDYDTHNPEQRHIYKFVRTLFNAAQLTAECAIITLVYLERLITYADIDMTPGTWKRIVLGAIILASKVWDDQAVWNVDYCQILRDISVDDMNELEREYLVLVQFNINVPSSVYAKYYFALRTLAESNDMAFPSEPLSKERAQKLEAMSRVYEDKYTQNLGRNGHKKWSSLDNISSSRRSVAILS